MTLTLIDVRDEVAEARASGAQPRVHPNGFIQLDLLVEPGEESWADSKKQGHSGGSRRLHIWNPPGIELPHQDTDNEIHDHVFDMQSTVVRGRLMQSLYEFRPQSPDEMAMPTHETYRAVYDKKSSSRLEPTGEQGWLDWVQWFFVSEGMSYWQDAFTLHDTRPDGLVVTVMEKVHVHEGNPTIVCEIGHPPDNDFDRASAAPHELLWEAIERSVAA